MQRPTVHALWRRPPGACLTTFLLAAAVRTAWALYLGRHHPDLALFPDSSSYLDPAHSLLDHFRFDATADHPGRAMIFRTPGYPSFIAAVQLLLGRSIVPVLVVQGLVGALVAPMIVDLSRRLGCSLPAAATAGCIVALDPLSIVATGFVLTETLAQVTVVATVWLLIRVVQEHRWRLALAAGVAGAASLLIRPTLYYLAPALVLLLTWAVRRVDRRTMIVAGFALPLVVAAGGWHVRNHVVAHPNAFSAIEDVDVGLWRGVGVQRRLQEPKGDVRALQLATAEAAAHRAGSASPSPELLMLGRAPDDVDQIAYYAELRSQGLGQLRRHPDLALRDVLNGSAAIAVDVDETRFGLSGFTTSPLLEALLRCGLIVLYGTAALGAAVLVRRLRTELALLMLTVAYVLGTASGPEAAGRFRIPVLPLLVPLAVAGVVGMREWDRRRHRGGEAGGRLSEPPSAPA